MKRILLCLALVLSLAPAQAQTNAVDVPYSRNVPPIVLHRVPRGGTTVYFGACVLRKNEPQVLFHLYTAPMPAQRKKKHSEPARVLDIYQRKALGKNARPILINSIPLGTGGNDEEHRISAQVIWAHPERRYIPILLLDSFRGDMSFGSFSSKTLVIFPHGLKQKPTFASFSDGVDNSGGNDVSFDTTDERGYTRVKDRHMSPAEDSDPSNATQYYRWNGNGFSLYKKPAPAGKTPPEPV